MSSQIYTIPASAKLSLGGFTGYKGTEWNRFFWDSVRRFHPWYYLRHRLERKNAAWKENDCVFKSLKQNLLEEFGIFLPERTLFQVYNHDGKGILPRNLLKAISAVIEPLGLEIERVVVANEMLRAALGSPEQVTGLSGSAAFDGKPGICMINIKDGYSHAFYWKTMDSRKFRDDAFRMALRLRRKTSQPVIFSPLAGMESYRQMLQTYLLENPRLPQPAASQILDQLADLQAEYPSNEVTARLTSILNSLHAALPNNRQPARRELIEAGEMLLAIFQIAPGSP